ncbi:mntH [Symbiodinium necroappetens]|uniref:MntH protein n=1 Tax=Symbiodinium necroappetens TaxID=1628268 RepID=A0A813BCK7_9DINO|nr:mntH [Symbiodinium necroappetens]
MRLLMTMGPGLMVCFADTDGSCLITAADSGSEWRYKLLLLQIILVPILYCAQELTVRLALVRGKGLCALIRQEAGPRWAWIVAVPLLLDCVLALISELNVVGQTLLACWGCPLWVSCTLFALALMLLALTGSYAVAEKVGLAMGILQVFFFATIFMNRPSGSEIWSDLWTFPLSLSCRATSTYSGVLSEALHLCYIGS